MDNPGHSIFGGGSLHLDGIDARNEEEDLQREEEEEEENRRREMEIQDLLVNAFDDLEEEESYTQHSSHAMTAPGGGGGGGLARTLTDSYTPPQTHHQDPHGYQEYRSDLYDHQDGHPLEAQPGHFPEGQGSVGGASHSSSSSVTPWSEDSRGTSPTRFSPLGGHYSAGNALGGGTAEGGPYVRDYGHGNDQDLGVSGGEAYDGGGHRADHLATQDNQEILDLNGQYKEAETSYGQLKLLYEVRGREMDRQMSDYSKLQFESNRDIRALQHQLNLLRSDHEGKSASVKQLQILLSEKEERTKALVTDMKDLQGKLSGVQDENKKLHLQLETAESTISSLECQVSELQAMDSLSRNQKLQEEFIRKLQQGSQEEKTLLKSKLHESEKEAQSSQQEVKRLREELKNMRSLYDGAVMQKSETVTKLNVTIETLRKQYEQLLQAHDSQETLKLELKVKSLEASNQNVEESAAMLDIELKKAKEDLKSFDMAIKLGVMKDILPEEDSMLGLGIKQALTYTDTTVTDTHRRGSSGGRDEILKGKDSAFTVREELRKSLMINKGKREEIAMLREDVHVKQARIRKAASDLQDAHAEVKQLKEQMLRLQMAQDEREAREGSNSPSTDSKEKGLLAQKCVLQQEVACLMACVRDSKLLYNTLNDEVTSLKDSLSQDQTSAISTQVNEVLHYAEAGRKVSAEVECLHEMLTDMRNENAALHQTQALWERRLGDLEVKLKVASKMIVRSVTDPDKASEITPSLTTLQRLLGDLRELATEVKKEVQEAHGEKLKLQDRLATCQLDLEKAKDKIAKLEEENINLEAQFVTLEKDKTREKDAELECYQKTYLKFHEEAMHELEANIKVEYEQIVTDLKRKILKGNEELKEAKDCYIQMCQEKNQLEERLEQLLESKSIPVELHRLQQTARTTLSTPDSGISGEAQRGQVQEVMLHKEIETLKEELAFVKERYKEQSRKLKQQKEEQLALIQENTRKETVTTGQQTSEFTREMQETCSRLEEVNKELRDQSRDNEAEILRLNEMLSKEATSEMKGAWYGILERQQKRMDDERKELMTYYGNIIEELQSKYTSLKRPELLEAKIKEQESSMNTMSDKILELEEAITALHTELGEAREDAQLKEEDREKEVGRLTDLLQNKEDELREKQEQNDAIGLGFQEYIKKVNGVQNHLKEKIQQAETDLKEKERKYIHLKLKFKKYSEVISQNKYYKSELNRVWDDYVATKASIIAQVKDCLEEVKAMFVQQVEVVKENLGDLDGTQTAEALAELDQLSSNVKNYELLIS